jgi:hypothetical protein
MATLEHCPGIPYEGKTSGYIRHDIDCNPVAIQPKGVIVHQKIGDISYRVWNGDYQRSLTEPVSKTGDPTVDAPANKDPKQPQLLGGFNGDYIKEDWWDSSAYQKKVSGMSEKYVYQTIYQKWKLDSADPGTLEEGINQVLISAYDPYVRSDFCGVEINFTVRDGKIIPQGDIILAMEQDRDDTFYTEDANYVIQLEVNTELYQVDYENDYFLREEGDIALSYENDALIEPS